MPLSTPRVIRRDRGFALLITITLLAFLVLLLVSLASLTRVETQVASNNQQIAQARQNALMAMNVALGRLQELAGPDQRVTGTADLINVTAGSPASRHETKRNWVGIWDARATNAATGAKLGKNLGWLVSGTAPAELLKSDATITPNGVSVPLVAASGNALVELVGANTTDTSIEVGGVKINQVRVETQPVKSTGVPGFAATTEVTVGNFAYWVGDEGTKAKVTLVDPWENPSVITKNATGVSDATAAIYRFLSTPRMGIEGINQNALNDQRVGPAYPATDSIFKGRLPNVLSPNQLSLANPSGTTSLSAAAKARFHDLTASSLSVMTNVVEGGLKKDLTAWLSRPDGPTNLPRDTDYIADASTYMPRWSQIRSYASVVADGNPKAPVLQDAEALPTTLVGSASAAPKQGIYPVITYARMGYNVSCAGPGQPVAFHLFPVVTLWNPHNVPIAEHDYEMRFDDQDWYFAIALGKESEASAEPAAHSLQRRASYNKVRDGFSEAFATGYFAYERVTAANEVISTQPKIPLRFRLKSPQLEAGQSLVFTLSDPSGVVDAYSARNNRLEPFSPAQADNSVVLYGPTMTSADLAERFFFSNTGGQCQISLRDYTDPNIIYHRLQSSTTNSPFLGSTPTNVSFLIQDPGLITAPLIYLRTELYQSQGQHGPIADPTKWWGYNTRWLALFNPLAPHSLRMSGNGLTHYMDFQGITNAGPNFGTGNRASVGPGEDVSAPAGDLIVHEFLKPGVPLFSLAQLQHANVSQMNLYPAYAIGNSLASVYVKRDKTVFPDPSAVPADVFSSPQQLPFRNLTQVHDLSYVLNRALWDKYYFSTVPASLSSPSQVTVDYKLPNARHVFHQKNGVPTFSATDLAELKDTASAAAHLLINGGFNVNSTSVQAWRALLYSRNGMKTDNGFNHAFSRYADIDAGVSNSNAWNGYRVLSDAQIDHLSSKIVAEIKLRGPFVSLADFINRRLVPAPDARGLKGTLQAAIDAVDADASITSLADRINTRSPFSDPNTRVSTLAAATRAIPPTTTNVIRSHWIGDDNDANNDKPSTSRAAYAPGYLSQADLLTSLGPVLTARSDTFTIRAYGDVQNPSTSTIEGRAWCEAVVQRLPEYVETLNAWSLPVAGTNNERFGRRFRIVSFRWLTASDI
ncbi:MAG: hypothetical protein ABW223_05575 [Rariglobus sp.]